MAGSGSEKRRRSKVLKARVTPEEKALFRQQADRAGVSEGELLRCAAFDMQPLRASRRPTVDHEAAAQLLGRLGQCAAALRQAAKIDDPETSSAVIDAAHRDIAEMRVALFQALGREP